MSKPDIAQSRMRSAILRYGLSVLSVAISTSLTFLMEPFTFRTPLFFPAILVSSWFGGTAPGLLAVFLSVLSINFFLLEPKLNLSFSIQDIPHTVSFLCSALLISWWSAARKRAEEVLRAREQELRKARGELETKVEERTRDLAQRNEQLQEKADLLNLAHDTIFARDMNDVITYWNRGAEDLYGWKTEQAVGKVTHELLHTSFPKPLAEITAELLRTDRWEGELTHTKRDGTQVVVASRWSLQRDERRRSLAILETNNNITERKRAEDALRRQANLLEQTHDAIIVWEFLPTTIVFWNRGAEQLYGFSREEAIGRPTHKLLQTEHPLATPVFEAVLEREGEWTGELTHTTLDGRKLLVESRHVLVREPDGRRLVLETNRDITERKRAEQAVRKAQAELAHVSRVTTMGELTASIAHEVNQPLTAVVNNANASISLLPNGAPNVEEIREALTEIIADADRASAVVARIRQLAKRTPIEKSLVDLRNVVADVLAFARYELAARRITIRADLPNDLPSVSADRVLLQQVLLNLVVNGMDAMSTIEQSKRVLTICGRREIRAGTAEALLSVKDAGIGFKPEEMARLFETFYTTKPQGMGMGLAISRSIIEGHGGHLWAEPNEGAGATFSFCLPAVTHATS